MATVNHIEKISYGCVEVELTDKAYYVQPQCRSQVDENGEFYIYVARRYNMMEGHIRSGPVQDVNGKTMLNEYMVLNKQSLLSLRRLYATVEGEDRAFLESIAVVSPGIIDELLGVWDEIQAACRACLAKNQEMTEQGILND